MPWLCENHSTSGNAAPPYHVTPGSTSRDALIGQCDAWTPLPPTPHVDDAETCRRLGSDISAASITAQNAAPELRKRVLLCERGLSSDADASATVVQQLCMYLV